MRESLSSEFSLAETEKLIVEVLESGGEFELYPRGTSMLPLIVQGRDSVTLIKPNGRLSDGDIAFYKRTDGSFILHRVMSVETDSYTMCGDNQLVLESNIRDEQIIGVVSSLFVKGKKISVTDKRYKYYIKRRKNLKWRRILLGFARRIPFSAQYRTMKKIHNGG